MKPSKLVVLSGAGISAESGIPTFRDADGLWEGHDVMEVASPQGWAKNPQLVLEFYNQRRKAAWDAEPNEGHRILARLEQHFEVVVVTQNVDNLHERAGSSQVVHLHGELLKSRSTQHPELVYDMKHWELNWGDSCEKGAQLRPHIVWFGEMVPMMEVAVQHAQTADYFIVVGTSLLVYPAAGLIDFVGTQVPKFLVDPNLPTVSGIKNLTGVAKGGSEGLQEVYNLLLASQGQS